MSEFLLRPAAVAVAAISILLCAAPSLAVAEEIPAHPSDDGTWYGWQTLAIDGLALGVGLAFASSDRRTRLEHPPSQVATLGTSLYLVGVAAAPAVHFAHRQNAIGLADLSVRLLLPPLGSVMGMTAYCLATTQGGDFRSGCAGTGSTAGLLAGALFAAGIDAVAFARDRRSVTEISTDQGQRWYGWQLLLVDGLGVGLGVSAAKREPQDGKEPPSDALALAVGMYAVGFFVPPLVHFAHGRFFRGLGDWAARALLAPTGALVGLTGYCAATGGDDGCAATGAELGFLTGVVGAALFDAAALSWDDPPPPNQPIRAEVLPSFQLVRGGAALGVMGAF